MMPDETAQLDHLKETNIALHQRNRKYMLFSPNSEIRQRQNTSAVRHVSVDNTQHH